MLAMYLWLKNWFAKEEGQDLIEYALLIVLVVLIVAAALPGVATTVKTVFQNVTTQLGGTPTG